MPRTDFISQEEEEWFEARAEVCARFVMHYMLEPFRLSQSPRPAPPLSLPPLSPFIKTFLMKGRNIKELDTVIFTALYILGLLKDRLSRVIPVEDPATRYRLFVTAFMISGKMVCDAPFLNSSVPKLTDGLITTEEVNRVERVICKFLEYRFRIPEERLRIFMLSALYDFSGPGPYPSYTFLMPDAEPFRPVLPDIPLDQQQSTVTVAGPPNVLIPQLGHAIQDAFSWTGPTRAMAMPLSPPVWAVPASQKATQQVSVQPSALARTQPPYATLSMSQHIPSASASTSMATHVSSPNYATGVQDLMWPFASPEGWLYSS